MTCSAQEPERTAWKVSLHGGHSGAYCNHAEGTLEALIEAAVAAGYDTFGVAEHAPRVEARFLYPQERELGWDVKDLERIFDAYAIEVTRLAEVYSDRIHVLRGFEAEVVPEDRYGTLMLEYRERYGFDYLVGSVHWVEGISVDYDEEQLALAAAVCGGLEALCVKYYGCVAEMVETLAPEVVGHLDLVRKFAPDEASVSTPAIRRAAEATLDTVAAAGAILDLNTAGYRKGLGRPYPAPWIVAAARDRGIPFCFGDDSHRVGEVGEGLEAGRAYLLGHGVGSITSLARAPAGLVRKEIALDTRQRQ